MLSSSAPLHQDDFIARASLTLLEHSSVEDLVSLLPRYQIRQDQLWRTKLLETHPGLAGAILLSDPVKYQADQCLVNSLIASEDHDLVVTLLTEQMIALSDARRLATHISHKLPTGPNTEHSIHDV